MKKTISLLFILIFSFAAFAQNTKNKSDVKDKPDFSGTWVLDDSKTKDPGYDLTLIVAHKEPEMKVTKIYNFNGAKKTDERTYYTDGRAMPDTEMGSDTIKDEAFWSNLILVRTRQVTKSAGKTIVQTNTEKWELSKDGKTLILTMTETVPVTVMSQSQKIQNGQSVITQTDTTKVLKFKRDTNAVE